MKKGKERIERHHRIERDHGDRERRDCGAAVGDDYVRGAGRDFGGDLDVNLKTAVDFAVIGNECDVG